MLTIGLLSNGIPETLLSLELLILCTSRWGWSFFCKP